MPTPPASSGTAPSADDISLGRVPADNQGLPPAMLPHIACRANPGRRSGAGSEEADTGLQAARSHWRSLGGADGGAQNASQQAGGSDAPARCCSGSCQPATQSDQKT